MCDSIIRTALNSFPTDRLFHTVIVAMTVVGWFVLSNHCALGSAAKRTGAKNEHACCHNGISQPAKEPVDGKQEMQCCKSLHALMPDASKFGEPPPLLLVAVIEWAETLSLKKKAVPVSALDTGPPPQAASFSELVLHRSLRSHAPPLFV